MIFAQMLTNIMNEKKISAYKMSKETGISDSLIGYWKKGERVPNAENLILISNYLEVTIDYLLTGKCNEPNNILSEDKKRFLSMYELLTDMEKGEILGEMKNMIKNKSSETKKMQVDRCFIFNEKLNPNLFVLTANIVHIFALNFTIKLHEIFKTLKAGV